MKTKCLIVLSLFYSFSALSAASLADKRERVEELMRLEHSAPIFALEAYQREIGYEEMGLNLEERTNTEVQIFAEKVKSQVLAAFEAALEATGSVKEAKAEVLKGIDSDLDSAAANYQFELRQLALDTLEEVSGGVVGKRHNLVSIKKEISAQVKERNRFLDESSDHFLGSKLSKMATLSSLTNNNYNNKEEIIQALVSSKDSDFGSYGATNTVNTSIILKSESKISLQVKMEFLGAELEAGPTISFKREIATNATIRAEGLYPVITKSGDFDTAKRDGNNNIVRRSNQIQRRNIVFGCNAQMNFQTEYTGGGGFKYMGIGADVSVSTTYKNSVDLSSRTIDLPVVIGNKTTNVKVISDLCNRDFLAAKFNSQMTVHKSLDMMMRNVASGLVFAHSKTTCSKNSDCQEWFRKQPSIKKKNTVARCVQHKEEKYQFCQIRGDLNQNCPLYSKGKLITSGINEYPCDWNYKCVQQEPAYYVLGLEWSPAIGKCKRK